MKIPPVLFGIIGPERNKKMRMVKLGRILENAAKMIGREVAALGVPDQWKAIAALAIMEGWKKIAAEKLPMLRRVEYRRYRPNWKPDEGYVEGMEVWYEGEYYRALITGISEEPSKGDGWKQLNMGEVAAFIGWEQPWENTIIDVAGVDKNNFAYEADPKYNPNAKPVTVTGISSMGVTLKTPAPKGVWCVFIPAFPAITFEKWEAGRRYEAGECAYDEEEKEVYQAIKDVESGSGKPSANKDKWAEVRVPIEIENFLVKWIMPDLMTEDQSKYQSRAAADRAFEELCERYCESNGENRMKLGRFHR